MTVIGKNGVFLNYNKSQSVRTQTAVFPVKYGFLPQRRTYVITA
jgi:hypothetical protein